MMTKIDFEEKEAIKIAKLKKIGVVALVILGLVMAYNTVVDTGKANDKEAMAVSEVAARKEQQQIVNQRRETGFVEIRRTVNAFEETTAMDYVVISKAPGVSMVIHTGAKGTDIKELCFTAVTQDPKKDIFAPYTTIPVYAKFDGGETRRFNATRGANDSFLCIVSINRFLFNMTAAKEMQVAIPYLDHYQQTSEVAEFNLSTYNRMIK